MSARGIAIGAAALAGLLVFSAYSARAAGGLSRWEIVPVWSVPVPGVQMVADLPGGAGGPAMIVAQGPARVVVVDAAGRVLATRDFPGGPLNAAMGDVNGDGASDVILAQGSAAGVAAYDLALKPLWKAPAMAGLGQAARVLAVDLDGDGRSEVVVGDALGRVAAFSSAGRPLWSHAFPPATANAEIRGLDDLSPGKGAGRLVAVARRSGEIVLLDARGKTVAGLRVSHPVRRLRVFDLDGDGRDEALIGDEGGYYQALGADGKSAALGSLADAVTEIRALRSGGGTAPRSFVVAGKRGAFVLHSGRTVLASGSVNGKVSAAGGVDGDGDGGDELFIGTEEGGLFVFDRRGEPLAEMGMPGKIERILGVESALRDRLLVVGAGAALGGYRVRQARAPAWYSPWTPAAIGLVALAVGALAMARAIPPPPPVAPVVDARAEQIHLATARVADLMARGIATPEMGAARLKQLERQRAKRRV